MGWGLRAQPGHELPRVLLHPEPLKGTWEDPGAACTSNLTESSTGWAPTQHTYRRTPSTSKWSAAVQQPHTSHCGCLARRFWLLKLSTSLLILPLMTDRITGSIFPVAFILILDISLLLAWVLIPWKVASASLKTHKTRRNAACSS